MIILSIFYNYQTFPLFLVLWSFFYQDLLHYIGVTRRGILRVSLSVFRVISMQNIFSLFTDPRRRPALSYPNRIWFLVSSSRLSGPQTLRCCTYFMNTLDRTIFSCWIPPSFDETRKAIARLRFVKTAGVCHITVDLFEASSAAVMGRLHAIWTVTWQLGIIPPD